MASIQISLKEGLDIGLCATQDQSVYVVGALIGVYRFQIHHMADDVEFIGDTVATMHIPGCTGYIKRFAAVVAL